MVVLLLYTVNLG